MLELLENTTNISGVENQIGVMDGGKANIIYLW